MTMLCVENGDDDDDDDENDCAWFSPVCFCSLFSFFCKGMPLFFPFSIPRLLLDAHATRQRIYTRALTWSWSYEMLGHYGIAWSWSCSPSHHIKHAYSVKLVYIVHIICASIHRIFLSSTPIYKHMHSPIRYGGFILQLTFP